MIQNNIWELKLISRLELNEFQWNLKKKDNQEKILKLSEEIKKHWFNCPIAIWDNNWIVSILDWHQRKRALQLLADKGLTLQDDKIPCIYIKANTEKEAKQILLEYNTKYSQFDTVELQEWASDCDMEFLEIDEWEEPELVDEEKEAIEDTVPEVDETNIIVEKWDIFWLWDYKDWKYQHYLMCGDSTNIDDVEKLMNWEKADWVWTDPPYNIAFKPQRWTHWEILNDNMSDEQFEKFLFDYLTCQSTYTKDNSVAIIWMWWSTIPSFQKNIEKLYKIKSMPIWYKNNFGIGYWTRPQYEPCFLCLKWEPEKPNKPCSDVWEYQKVHKTIHSCEKPIQLIEEKINTFIKWSILDLFWWSWSTLIASEKTKRKCYMMELDPKYVSVIIRRFYDYTKWEKEIKCLNRELDISSIIH